jgi:hypothetical protein
MANTTAIIVIINFFIIVSFLFAAKIERIPIRTKQKTITSLVKVQKNGS